MPNVYPSGLQCYGSASAPRSASAYKSSLVARFGPFGPVGSSGVGGCFGLNKALKRDALGRER